MSRSILLREGFEVDVDEGKLGVEEAITKAAPLFAVFAESVPIRRTIDGVIEIVRGDLPAFDQLQNDQAKGLEVLNFGDLADELLNRLLIACVEARGTK